MSGFYSSDKMRKLEKDDETEKELRAKISRKHFSDVDMPKE